MTNCRTTWTGYKFLDSDLTLEEVKVAIKSHPSVKCPGSRRAEIYSVWQLAFLPSHGDQNANQYAALAINNCVIGTECECASCASTNDDVNGVRCLIIRHALEIQSKASR
ncbi:hypothetical protein NDU88_002690 [Pleurodeles waltl]|uniref:Uncharacterized protein n=1 Tax=Pleurodeles waltl TaxID=8319 RepID=A0AAV7UXZ3_PLEWA|nr:hypothetical protein NDU88_002690 [Pleurodeles waltl]